MENFIIEIWESDSSSLFCDYCNNNRRAIHPIVYCVNAKNGYSWYCPKCLKKEFGIEINKDLYPITFTHFQSLKLRLVNMKITIETIPEIGDFFNLFLKVLGYD